MKFDFDPNKSNSNKIKHGVDFVEAQIIWEDPDRLQVPAQTRGEKRWMLIGRIGRKHWSAIFTIRNNTIRIISVRRSRPQEVEQYED